MALSDKRQVILVGSSAVGKTSLVHRLIGKPQFVKPHHPTVQDSYTAHMIVDQHSCQLDIIDTGGQVQYVAMRINDFITGQAFLLMYSVYDKQSGKDIRRYYEQIVKAKHENKDGFVAVLVANKSGERNNDDGETKVQVDLVTEQGVKLAESLNIPFFEISVKNQIHIQEPFEEIIRLCRAKFGANCNCRKPTRCTCYDECRLCRKPRLLHNSNVHTVGHPFQEAPNACCTIQ